MNTLVIVLIAAVVLVCAYAFYGRWVAKTWGINPNAQTPAVKYNDGKDYVPTNGWTVFAHQFSSIAGAGPVTGAIQAAAFGWLPVLLWVLLGGIFFGAVTDFGALYASVKNDGKSMGMLIEKYIGKTGRKLFLLFCWLFCGIVIAAFADMVAGTFNAYSADGALVEAAQTNGAAGMVSIMFMVFAVVFGLLQKNLHFTGWKENVISIVFIVLSFVVGANFPIILGKAAWSYITFVYIFFAAVLPADDPEIIVYVMLDDPNNARTDYSSLLAAPVVGNIISEIAPYLGIAADGEDRSQTVVTVPNLVGTEWSSAQVQLNIKGLRHQLAESTTSQAAAAVTYQYPHAGAKVAYGTTVYLYTDTYEGSHTDVPDVTGKSADFARQMLSAAGLNCVVEGNANGTVQAQSADPGSSVQRGTIVIITCG